MQAGAFGMLFATDLPAWQRGKRARLLRLLRAFGPLAAALAVALGIALTSPPAAAAAHPGASSAAQPQR